MSSDVILLVLHQKLNSVPPKGVNSLSRPAPLRRRGHATGRAPPRLVSASAAQRRVGAPPDRLTQRARGRAGARGAGPLDFDAQKIREGHAGARASRGAEALAASRGGPGLPALRGVAAVATRRGAHGLVGLGPPALPLLPRGRAAAVRAPRARAAPPPRARGAAPSDGGPGLDQVWEPARGVGVPRHADAPRARRGARGRVHQAGRAGAPVPASPRARRPAPPGALPRRP
jgi:hypothetical protein